MKAHLSWPRRNAPALVLFAIVFGGLYLAATREYQRLPSVKRNPQARYFEVTPEKPFDLHWRARTEGVPAPALGLHLPGFLVGGMFSETGATRLSGDLGQFHLYGMLPDPDGLSSRALGNWCAGGLASEECSLAQLRLTVKQADPGRSEPGQMVMESRARGFSDAAASGPIRRLNAFWVKPVRETGRQEFVGWDCQGEAPTGRASTDLSLPLLERNRCFEPAPEERRSPKLHGYERVVQLTACAGDGRQCQLYFPYRGRYVEVVPERTTMTAKSEEATGHLFLAAWEMMNRRRADSVRPPDAATWLARATAALQNCRAIEAALPPPASPGYGRFGETRQHARWQCAYAANAAYSAMRERPAEAHAVMHAALLTASFATARELDMRREAIEAMAAAGAQKSAAFAEAHLAIAERMRDGLPASAERAAKRAAFEEALRVADAALAPGSGTHLALFKAWSSTWDPADVARLPVLERWRAAALQAQGPSHAALAAPTYERCRVLSYAQRTAELRACADEFLPVWRDIAAREAGERFSDETGWQGLELMRWYWQASFAEDNAAEVLPTVRALAAAIQPRVHPEAWAQNGARAVKAVEGRAQMRGRGR